MADPVPVLRGEGVGRDLFQVAQLGPEAGDRIAHDEEQAQAAGLPGGEIADIGKARRADGGIARRDVGDAAGVRAAQTGEVAEIGAGVVNHLHPVEAGAERGAAFQGIGCRARLVEMEFQPCQRQRVGIAQGVFGVAGVEEMHLFERRGGAAGQVAKVGVQPAGGAFRRPDADQKRGVVEARLAGRRRITQRHSQMSNAPMGAIWPKCCHNGQNRSSSRGIGVRRRVK